MSGWLLMGLPGAIYLSGLGEAWLAIDLTLGAYLNLLFVAPRLRAYTQVSNNSNTIPSFLENRLKDTSHLLRVASGIIILAFFTSYVSSGMVAGGKFFQSSFGLEYHTGLIIVSVVVLAHTLFGGFLAVSYTDFVQGLIMFLALGIGWMLLSLIGAITVRVWGNVKFLSSSLYEIVPGFTICLLVAILVSKITYKHAPVIEKEYDDTMELLEEEN